MDDERNVRLTSADLERIERARLRIKRDAKIDVTLTDTLHWIIERYDDWSRIEDERVKADRKRR